MTEELKIYKDIDINFIRLSKPEINTLDIPLSGIYNNIDNNEYPNYPLKNKFKNFTTTLNGGLGAENLFLLKNTFDKLITEEFLEGLIILSNNSTRDVIIKNVEISLIFETQQKTLTISLPDKDNTLFLSPNQSYSIKVKNYLKKKGKYSFDVKFWTKSFFYDQQYNMLRQKAKIRENKKYKIIDNHVEYYNNKIFSFNVSEPFEIIDETIPFNEAEKKDNNFLINTKIFSLLPEEELNLFFKNDSKELFLFEEKFILYIKWLKLFDFSPKNFEFEFNNELEIFNEYFFFLITERPKGNIILDHDFPIIFQFVTKQPKKNFELIIRDYENDNNKSDNEVAIIIKEYKFALNEKCQKYDVNIICKSDKTGRVKFPKILIKIMESGGRNILGEYIYKNLLCFNCVENVQLI